MKIEIHESLITPVLDYYKITKLQWSSVIDNFEILLYSSNIIYPISIELNTKLNVMDINHFSEEEKQALKELFKLQNNE